MVKTSVIIVNYNGETVIGECLEALLRQSEENFEIIVVDNDSKDGSVAMIKQRFPSVALVPLERNLGFTGGNIEGLRRAAGKYICLLNPDTEAANDWLERLVAAMDQHPEAGVCASRLMVYGTDIVDSAGDGCAVTGRGYKRGEGQPGLNYQTAEPVFGACGGAMLIRRKVIDRIGFLDDDFFLIYEDTDFNFRVRLSGWQCWYEAGAVVYHKVRSSIGAMSDQAVYYSVRNARYVLIKNMPLRLILKNLLSHLVQEAGCFLYFVVKHGKWRQYINANIAVIGMLPRLLKKRKKVMALKRIADCELETMLTPVWNKDFFRQKWQKLFYSDR